jgi:hypothetical protein
VCRSRRHWGREKWESFLPAVSNMDFLSGGIITTFLSKRSSCHDFYALWSRNGCLDMARRKTFILFARKFVLTFALTQMALMAGY